MIWARGGACGARMFLTTLCSHSKPCFSVRVDRAGWQVGARLRRQVRRPFTPKGICRRTTGGTCNRQRTVRHLLPGFDEGSCGRACRATDGRFLQTVDERAFLEIICPEVHPPIGLLGEYVSYHGNTLLKGRDAS